MTVTSAKLAPVPRLVPVPVSVLVLAAGLLLAACSQKNAPSEQMEHAADQLVEVVQGDEPSPKLAAGAYAPRDECKDLPDAESFLADLRSAIDTQDAEALVSLAAEDVKLDFGGGSGPPSSCGGSRIRRMRCGTI